MRRTGWRLPAVVVASMVPGPACLADSDKLPEGYSMALVSGGVGATAISQLAFKPGDVTHVYAARNSASEVTRYDYDPVTGLLANPTTVASNPHGRSLIGIGFHGADLYVTFEYGQDGRIARYRDLDGNGIYETRHDIVHGVPTGAHGMNQIQIAGDSLYVGIGAAGRRGDPSEESVYTMTVARIADLNQVVTVPEEIGSNFKGPVNYLAGPDEWTHAAGTDGQLRYFASGFRNPFGIAVDPDGDLWVSVNGNSDAGFLSDDFIYRKVQSGSEGNFPPPEFGYSKYISGTPVSEFVNLGLSPSPTGFDFIVDGPEAGKVVVANAGATRVDNLGRDLMLLDASDGTWQQIYQFSTSGSRSLITDVKRDPFGRFLVADYALGNVWLLTPPRPLPRLTPELDHGMAELTWPLSGVGFILEEASSPDDPESWTESPAVTSAGPDGFRTRVPIEGRSRFFRLKR